MARRSYTAIDVPNEGLQLRDTDGSHVLTIKPGANLTANRVLTLDTGDADRTLTLPVSGGSGLTLPQVLAAGSLRS